MARICREIQERIEETREEAREECRNVSREITETICSWMPWPFSELCDLVTRIITEVVCAIVWVVVTVVSWVTRIVCEIIFVIDWLITHLVGVLEWLGNRIITFPEWLICQAGVGTGRRRFRICPMVIADEAGNPIVPLDTIQSQIDQAIEIWEQCNITVSASDIRVITGRSHLAAASGCNAGGYFSGDRSEYEHLSCCDGLKDSLRCLRFPSGLLWPRHILKAIWVTSIDSGERGCYMMPESFVLVTVRGAIDTLAHEMGHAGDLLHNNDDNTNLMFTPTRVASNLSRSQCCTVRTSRFVTLF
jgi:hypothetical protein